MSPFGDPVNKPTYCRWASHRELNGHVWRESTRKGADGDPHLRNVETRLGPDVLEADEMLAGVHSTEGGSPDLEFAGRPGRWQIAWGYVGHGPIVALGSFRRTRTLNSLMDHGFLGAEARPG